MRSASIRGKTAIIILGVFLSVLLLEALIRITGGITSSLQERRNRDSLRKKAAYRIMCLGESTTAIGGEDSYPAQLQDILNESYKDTRFIVINKGVTGCNSSGILSLLEENLQKYRPDMVIAMMGHNDGGVVYYKDIRERGAWIFRHSALYRFARLLYNQIIAKMKEANALEPAEASADNRLADGPEDDYAYTASGQFYIRHNDNRADEMLKKAIALNPHNECAHVELGLFYKMQDMPLEAKGSFKKALEINAGNALAHQELGWLYIGEKKLAEAEREFKLAIKFGPENSSAYIGLSLACFGQQKFAETEQLLYKVLELIPDDDFAYAQLATIYRETGRDDLCRLYIEKTEASRRGRRSLTTVNNYRRLKRILDEKGIRLVCVQYPARNMAPLKDIFRKDERVMFVDNEKIFKDALKKGSYKEYFLDMFAGDFGHATRKGNRLLAGNIARVILKDVFKHEN